MKGLDFGRVALTMGVAVALLAAAEDRRRRPARRAPYRLTSYGR